MAKKTIQVQNLTKGFEAGGAGRFTVLDDLSFSVEEGGITSVLGPSGCGKTTLLRIIAGVESPDRGTVAVHPGRHGGTLSLVYQENDLLPWLTVEGNVALAARAAGRDGGAQSKAAGECLEKVGMGGFGGFYPSQLSGGMQKRASLARALAADREVILCDEPLAFLDFQSRLGLQRLIEDLFVEQGKTILYVTHDVYEAVNLSRRTVILTARPARIKTVIDIPFCYPRDIDDLERSREYHEVVAAMKDALREEILKTDEMEKSAILGGRK